MSQKTFCFRLNDDAERSLNILAQNMDRKKGDVIKRVIIEAAKRLSKNPAGTNKKAL